jgi:hypothetical protein
LIDLIHFGQSFSFFVQKHVQTETKVMALNATGKLDGLHLSPFQYSNTAPLVFSLGIGLTYLRRSSALTRAKRIMLAK